MGLRSASKQHEALICKSIEHLAAFRSGTMASIIENLKEPRGCNDTEVDKIGEGKTSPTSKWKMHSC